MSTSGVPSTHNLAWECLIREHETPPVRYIISDLYWPPRALPRHEHDLYLHRHLLIVTASLRNTPARSHATIYISDSEILYKKLCSSATFPHRVLDYDTQLSRGHQQRNRTHFLTVRNAKLSLDDVIIIFYFHFYFIFINITIILIHFSPISQTCWHKRVDEDPNIRNKRKTQLYVKKIRAKQEKNKPAGRKIII